MLVAAFTFYFRLEVECDQRLFQGLTFDLLRQLSASQEQALAEVKDILESLQDQYHQMLAEWSQSLDRIAAGVERLDERTSHVEQVVVETQTVAVATRGAVLDMQAEMQRLDNHHGLGGMGGSLSQLE